MNKPHEKTILNVSQLNRRAKQLLETHLPLIWVSGEISNLAKPASGHWYFTLKDDKAQVRCAMFRNANQRVRIHPQNGDQVLLRARVSLYEGRGEYQVIAEHMEPAGAGQLQQQYEALKAKLEAEGLFDQEHKKEPPAFPQHIGVITSPTGAAIHDILTVLKRRYPSAMVTIIPVSVQGETAVPEMLNAFDKLHQLNQKNNGNPCDVVIIGRGGGSIEDLWAFNNEQLARAIYHCSIPVVSAVGHEVDFTIADFVADQRAPTPSASAEMITPDLNEWLQVVDYYEESFAKHISRKLQLLTQQVSFLHQRLRHPTERIRSQEQQLSHLQKRLTLAIHQKLTTLKSQFADNNRRFSQQHPREKVIAAEQQLSELSNKLSGSVNQLIETKQQRFSHIADLLNAISPLTVIARGYSITQDKNGHVIKDTGNINVGDELISRVSTGSITSVVKKLS